MWKICVCLDKCRNSQCLYVIILDGLNALQYPRRVANVHIRHVLALWFRSHAQHLVYVGSCVLDPSKVAGLV